METLFDRVDRKDEKPVGVVVFDLETKLSQQDVGGWDKTDKMGMALSVLYYVERGEYETFFEKDADRLVETLLRAERVVGYNHISFDYGVLRGYTQKNLRAEAKNLDLLDEVKKRLPHRLSLDSIAKATLGIGKTADGLQSLQWVKQGRFDLIEEYCKKDVEITYKVWRHGAEKGFILYDSRAGGTKRLDVSWPK